MKILITGGAGFIGSHLVTRLASESDTEIRVLDNLSRGKTRFIQEHIDQKRIKFIQGDIRDGTQLEQACRGVDMIFHLAAQSNVMGSVKDFDYSLTTNINGTCQVLKAAAACKVKRVVFSSSREVYGDPNYLPVDENHPFNARNPYGASKIAGELYCRVFQRQYNLDVRIVRLANVYGPRDFDRVIPIWIERALNGQELVVYGGQQVIDFVWIEAVIEALIRISRLDESLDLSINIGSGKGTPLMAVADKIHHLADRKIQISILPARNEEVVSFIAKTDRMRTILKMDPPEDPLYWLPELFFSNAKIHSS